MLWTTLGVATLILVPVLWGLLIEWLFSRIGKRLGRSKGAAADE